MSSLNVPADRGVFQLVATRAWLEVSFIFSNSMEGCSFSLTSSHGGNLFGGCVIYRVVQRYVPQCKSCSGVQSSAVRTGKSVLVSLLRLSHSPPVPLKGLASTCSGLSLWVYTLVSWHWLISASCVRRQRRMGE
jgi:hypothetical protein